MGNEQNHPWKATAIGYQHGEIGGYLFAHYMVDVVSKIEQLDYQKCDLVRKIHFPGLGTASGLEWKNRQTQLYYTFTNYVTPPTIFSFDVELGNSEIYQRSESPFESDQFEV